MQLHVPHIPQKNDYTCGPCALRMVLAYHGLHLETEKLARLGKTSERSGTSRANLIHAAKKLGFDVEAKSDAHIKDLIAALDDGLPILVNYRPKNFSSGHYAVVIGYTPHDIILNDPWMGKTYTISRSEFTHSWFGYHKTRNRHWMMIVKTR